MDLVQAAVAALLQGEVEEAELRQCGRGPEGLHVPRRQGDGVVVLLPLQRVHVQPQGLADLLGTAVPGDALKLYAGGLRRGSRLTGAAAQPRQQAEAQRDGGDRKNSPRFHGGYLLFNGHEVWGYL